MAAADPQRVPNRVPATVAEARALAHPLRLRIIRLLYDRSLTNRELAQALGENPATVLHHVRTLLRTGFIAADRERRGARGNVEKPYRSTGRSWTVDLDDAAVADVSRAALEAFLAELRDAQPHADLGTSRLAVNLSADAVDQLHQRFTELLNEYETQAPDPDGEPWSVFVALHRRAPLPLGTTADADPSTHTPAHTPTQNGRMNLEISDCAPDDPMAVLLVRAQWTELGVRYGQPEPEPSSIRDPSAFTAPTGAFLVARVAGEVVGCGGICRYDDTSAEINAIYVSPIHRGHGYSRAIVKALETRAITLGYRRVCLETGDAQPEAIALYTALGYTPIERFGVYRDLPRSVCFERTLEPAPNG
jgi:GNAT superfamily N-acetyltransferase/DNA-binding transcriptional ArsR family regulator